MVFRFNGGDCTNGFNVQPPKFYQCFDFNGGPPTVEGDMAYVVITDTKGGGIQYYNGYVPVGSEITVSDKGNKILPNMNITTYASNDTNPSNILQTLIYHSSCSQKLFLGDRYGGYQLIIFVNDEQGVVSSFFNATFNFYITNTGLVNASLESLVSVTNFGVYNFTDQVLGEVVQPAETFVVSESVVIDLTIRKTYTSITTVVASTIPTDELCRDTDFFNFTAGFPVPTTSPTKAPKSKSSKAPKSKSSKAPSSGKGKGQGPSTTSKAPSSKAQSTGTLSPLM